jgi:hypothetical protein
MPEEKILPKDRIASSFKTLATVSLEINEAAKGLGKSVGSLEGALKTLDLGVPAWHRIAGYEDHDGLYWTRDIGYTMVGQSWRIALRKTSGHHGADVHDEEVWPFNDAPRWMCVESVGKLPDLFDELIKRTVETTAKIKARTVEAEELAAAVREMYAELAVAKKGRK